MTPHKALRKIVLKIRPQRGPAIDKAVAMAIGAVTALEDTGAILGDEAIAWRQMVRMAGRAARTG